MASFPLLSMNVIISVIFSAMNALSSSHFDIFIHLLDVKSFSGYSLSREVNLLFKSEYSNMKIFKLFSVI